MKHRAELVLADPNASEEDLFRIAQERPDLLAKVAEHPNAYPDLLAWLGSLGDPHIDAALRRRENKPLQVNVDHFGVEPTGSSAPAAPSAQPVAVPVVREDQRERKVLLSIIAIVLALLLVLGVFWVFIATRDSDSASVAEPTQTVEPQPTSEARVETRDPEPGGDETDADESDEPTEEPTEEEIPEIPGPYVPDAPSVDIVSAPSGNIACRAASDGSWSCTIYDYNFTNVPEGGCDGGAVTVRVDPEGNASTLCSQDVHPGEGTLAYGQTVRLGDSGGCTSTEQGMRCWSGVSNTGVNIARAGITEITGP